MKKLFLTSGVILCMACPAVATTDIPSDGSGATCTYTYLGDYEGPVNYEAKWTAKSIGISYNCGTAPTVTGLSAAYTMGGTAPTSPSSATFDGSLTLPTTPNTCMPSSTTAGQGFYFSGWSCNPNPETGASSAVTYDSSCTGTNNYTYSSCTVSKTINPWQAASAVTCTAQWDGKNFKVKYATGTAGSRTTGFSGTMSDQKAKYNSSVTLTSNAFSITGYEFTGWKGDYRNDTGAAAANTAYTNGQELSPYRIAHDLTLTAQWAPKCYGAYTLDANKYNATTDTTKDYTVTASPTSVYVKYDNGFYQSGCSDTQSITPPSLTGYTFGGYYTAKNGGGTQMVTAAGAATSSAKTTTASATTWYAKWTANTVSNGLAYSCGTAPTVASTALTFSNSTPPPSVNTTYDNSYTIAATTTCALSGTGSAGYHWGGWSCQNNPENNSTDAVTYTSTYNSTNSRYEVSKTVSKWKATSAVTCTAQWVGNSYYITFDANTKDINNANLVNQSGTAVTPSGSTGDSNSREYFTYNEAKNLTANGYSVTGYSFDGWSSSKTLTSVAGTGTASYSNTQSINKYIYPANDAVLTAKWKPNTSGTITLVSSVYPSNNRSSSATYTTSTSEAVTNPTTTQVHTAYNTAIYSGTSGTTAITPANMIPTKAGYTFGGFYDSANTTQYIDASGNATAAGKRAITSSGGTATWYANWSKTKYNVVYKAGEHGTGSDYTHTSGAEYDSAYTTKTLSQTGITANTGYSFAGWKGGNIDGSNSSVSYNGGTNIGTWKIAGGNTFTAQWTAIAQNVTWSCGTYNSTNIPGSVGGAASWTYDSSYTLPSTPGTCNTGTSKVNGIHFTGYVCTYHPGTGTNASGNSTAFNATCGSTDATINTCTVSQSGTFKGTGAITCTAQWAANTVKPITYYRNYSGSDTTTVSGTGTGQCTYGGGITLPTNPTRTGYTFSGWTVR